MRRSNMIIAVAAVVLLLGIGGWALTRDEDDKANNNSQSAASNTESPASSGSENSTQQPETGAATITYTNDGFSPEILSVKAGDQIMIKNSSSQELEFSSDDHPVHSDNPELNTRVLTPNERITITVSKKGTWGYHNHLFENHSGKIIVE